MNPQDSARDILQQYWGFDSFRNPQDEIIESILDSRDTVALLPTGGGKSICFQVPSLCLPHATLVISPLIALMDDQVQNLKGRKIYAEALHSGKSYQDQQLIQENALAGKIKLLYVSPEKLLSKSFREWLTHFKVSMIAIDEAHCVSEWGHDFRPSYLKIPEIYEILDRPRLAAFTATATPKVLADLHQRLKMIDPNIVKANFKRENLSYHIADTNHKFIRLCEMMRGSEGSCIVYMRSRKGCMHIADKLRKEGFSAQAYHAGMNIENRTIYQDDWIKGKTRIIVATSAFGMGIDKSDVRLVVHYELPESLEAYIQEAGRAGRDGERSYAIMLRTSEDQKKLKEKKAGLLPPFERIQLFYDCLMTQFNLPIGTGGGKSFDIDLDQFADHFQFERREINFALDFLAREGMLEETTDLDRWSKMMFRLSGERLYAFQVEYDRYALLIKYLLRAYEGITFEYCDIHENKISKITKISRQNIKKQLNYLQKEGVLTYLPAPEKQRIRLLIGRQNSKYFSSLKQRHTEILKRRSEKFQASMDYLFANKCRERVLLEYFGEELEEDCGKCDYCYNRRHEPNADEILGLLIDGPLKIEALSTKLNFSKDLLKPVLTALLDEGRIELDDEGKIGLQD